MKRIYDENMDSGTAQALSRRKGDGIGIGDRKEISVLKDAGTYEKHSKLYYWLSDFVDGKLCEFETRSSYDKAWCRSAGSSKIALRPYTYSEYKKNGHQVMPLFAAMTPAQSGLCQIDLEKFNGI